MSILVSRAQEVLGRAGLVGRGLLVGLSGGADSVALLHLLLLVRETHGGRMEVAHVDHGLRPSSADDAAFCEDLGRRFGLPFHLLRLTPGDFGRGGSLQAEARRLRRCFFETTRLRRGLDAVALGHHADDQVETVLFRLIRGAGPRGISGMAEWNPPYVRPLLRVRRQEIERAAAVEGWVHREDPTNREARYSRNRLRHEVLPLLRSVHPGVEEAILRHVRLAREDDEWLSVRTMDLLSREAVREPEGLRICAARIADAPPPIRRRLYLAAWEAVGCSTSGLEMAHLDAVDSLLAPGRAHRMASVPGPGAFVRSYADVWALAPGFLYPAAVDLQIAGPGRVPCENLGAAVEWGLNPPPHAPSVGVPAGRGRGGVRMRTWRAGDRVDPGSGALHKVKDLLMEARVPLWRRRRSLVVSDADGTLGLLSPERAWGRASAEAGWVWLAPDR